MNLALTSLIKTLDIQPITTRDRICLPMCVRMVNFEMNFNMFRCDFDDDGYVLS